jgi:hypothetical protein
MPDKKRPRGFKVGDKVEILGYRRLAWGDRKPQRYGFIVNINGAYHLVRPRWRPANELFEFYPNEIRLAKSSRKR